MHELMPVLFGAVLGIQLRRGALSKTVFIVIACLAATAACIASGEFARSALWVFSDLALVCLGAVTPWLPTLVRSARRSALRYGARPMQPRERRRRVTDTA